MRLWCSAASTVTPGRPSTSGGSRSRTSARSQWWSTGEPRWPSRSIGRPAGPRWAFRAAGTSRSRGAPSSAIEDELFNGNGNGDGDDGLVGPGALIAALEQSRTGQLGDIVATIQAEQDEIIRSPLHGVLVVQGGPGTGKTVVALHRAAYLLYTYRFPLEDQGVLVVGPNRVFLRYIHRVLPSLGESGVEQVVLADLVPAVRIQATDATATARVKGHVRMAALLANAVHDRQRALPRDLVVPFGLTSLRLDVETSRRIVRGAARRAHTHNAARRFVEQALFDALAASSRDQVDSGTVRERTRSTDEVRAALEAMWPVLTPAQLLHDLFGSRALIRLAARGQLDDDEIELLARPRSAHVDDVVWTDADVPLLDEALELLGPKPARPGVEADEIRTYGHIVVDEAQDLTPMALRMLTRRSLNGSMTVVGDLAQATGAFAPDSWDDVLAHLPNRKPARVARADDRLSHPRAVDGAGGARPVDRCSESGAAAVGARRRRGAGDPSHLHRRI